MKNQNTGKLRIQKSQLQVLVNTENPDMPLNYLMNIACMGNLHKNFKVLK